MGQENNEKDKDEGILSNDEILELFGEIPKVSSDINEKDSNKKVGDAQLSKDEIEGIIDEVEKDKDFKIIEDIEARIDKDNIKLEDIDDILSSDLLDNAFNPERLMKDDISIEELKSLEDDDLEFIKDVTVYDNDEQEDPFEKVIKKTEEKLMESLKEGEELSTSIYTVDSEDVDLKETTKDKIGNFFKRFKRGKSKEFIDIDEVDNIEKDRKFVDKLSNVNPIFITVLLIFLIVLTLISGSYAVYRIRDSYKPNNEILMDAPVAIQTEFANNKPNYIYLDSTNVENPNIYGLKLIKFFLGKEKTIFYFDTKVKWSDYKIELYDDNGNSYTVGIDAYDSDYSSKEISFGPLDTDTKGIVLKLEDKSGSIYEYPIKFDKLMYKSPSVYQNAKSKINISEIGNIEIANAIFNLSQTSINYRIKQNEDESFDFKKISVSNGSNKRIGSEDERFLIGTDTIVGNMKIPPVENLGGVISINFEDVDYKVKNNMTINPQQLFVGNEEEIVYTIGDYSITLERLGKMGPYFVLVLNGEDNGGKRYDTKLDTELILNNYAGEEIVIEGECISNERGTDIIFDTREVNGVYSLDNIKELKINNTSMNIGKVSRDINLANTENKMNIKSKKIIDNASDYLIEEGFEQVEPLYYYADTNYFESIFKTLKDGIVEEYNVNGDYYNNSWKFNKKLAERIGSK